MGVQIEKRNAERGGWKVCLGQLLRRKSRACVCPQLRLQRSVFPGGGLFTPAKSGIQRRILCLLKSCLRFLIPITSEDMLAAITRWLKKLAILKRDEGIDRLREPMICPITEGIMRILASH